MRLVFSHGNSFPAGSYQPLIDRWSAAGWQVSAVEKFGHDPAFPVTSNWPHLREQLRQHLQTVALADARPGEKAWLVGHSLGGLLSLMVALRYPSLVHGVLLLDSPVVMGWRAHSVHVAKLSGLIRKVSPGKTSAHRREQWPSRAAARAHFSAKTAFARWDPSMLDAYLSAGFVSDGDGEAVRLAFDRRIETQIYNTLPHRFPQWLRKHPLKVPLGFIAGTQSVEMRQGGSEGARRLAGAHYHRIEGSHLYPMERPAETAALVLSVLQALQGR